MLPTHRAPTPPGEILLEEFLKPHGLTQIQLATRLGVAPQSVNLLVNGRRAVTAETAVKLARVFDTTPEFWLALQTQCDLWDATRKLATWRPVNTRTRAAAPQAAARTPPRAAPRGRRGTRAARIG